MHTLHNTAFCTYTRFWSAGINNFSNLGLSIHTHTVPYQHHYQSKDQPSRTHNTQTHIPADLVNLDKRFHVH
jgi:hypothetical protein